MISVEHKRTSMGQHGVSGKSGGVEELLLIQLVGKPENCGSLATVVG